MTTNPITSPLAALYDARRITPGDPEWPDQLNQLDPPVTQLWVTGTSNLHDVLTESITICGARASTSLGNLASQTIAGELAEQGWTVVTGGSFGIDAAATRGAICVRKAPTVIVAASGLNHVYPSAHTALFASVLTAGGLIVSESDPDTRPNKTSFIRRNQLIGVMTSGVVMVEAANRSGSKATVHAAESIGAPVFAVPGPITSMVSRFPHELIRDGRAALVTSAADILEEFGR